MEKNNIFGCKGPPMHSSVTPTHQPKFSVFFWLQNIYCEPVSFWLQDILLSSDILNVVWVWHSE